MLVGGPSQLETWDPKPEAPAEIRGPFRSIATCVPGVRIGEHLPRLASAAHRYAIVRTVHHAAAPIHETGLQLLQTGRLNAPRANPGRLAFGSRDRHAGPEGSLRTLNEHGLYHPHCGSVLAKHFGDGRRDVAAFVVLPTPLGNTGMNLTHSQDAGFLGSEFEPRTESRFTQHLPPSERDRYGKTAFGDACLRARQLVEGGTRCVVVNMFETVYDRVTWDCHADRYSLCSTLDDYRRLLCPTFDVAFASLLEDLRERGLLDETLVVAMGELGRTPRLNARGGRDHWPGCWSIVMAGGGIRGGRAVGASDRHAAEPARRPVACAEVVATIYHAMGLSPNATLALSAGGIMPVVDAAPIRELF